MTTEPDSERKIISIFISSPGDVEMERQRTKLLIERIALEFSPWAKLDPYFWEHEPHDSSVDFTTSIGPTSDYDIVVVILRGRLGTRLNSAHQKVDGGVYRSGTEYEVLTALEAQNLPPGGRPQLNVFLNIDLEPLDLSLEKSKRDQITAQYDALQEFINEHFQAPEIDPDGKEILTNKRSYNTYKTLDRFEELLEKTLRGALKGLLGIETEHQSVGTAGVRPEKSWEGSPFMKLDVFEAKHAPIYFGRTRAIGQVVEKLKERFGSGSGFLMVFGASGSGKSSLMRAGVLPMVTTPGMIPGVGLWRQSIFKPSEGSGDLFLALAAALLSDDALPGLGDRSLLHKEDRMRKLAEELSQGATAIVARIEGRLSADAELERERQVAHLLLLAREFEHGGRPADAEAARDRAAALPIPMAGFILVVDQMEELYTGTTEEGRKAFLDALCALAKSRMVLVTATLRSDFYSCCEGHTELMRLKEVGNYHLDLPTGPELLQMIREPARAAGLIYEEDPKRGRLDDHILKAAAADPDSLPLLEMCLDRLYEVRDIKKGALTYSGYEKIGELEGVLTTHADEVFLAFCGEEAPSKENEDLLNEVIKTLASPRAGEAGKGASEAGEGVSVVRNVVPYDAFESLPGAQRLVDQFIEKRLFTGGSDTAGRRVVAVTHEALLRNWKRVKDMLGLEDNQHFLQVRTRVELRFKQWEESGKDNGFLLQKGKEIEEAEELDTESPHVFVDSVKKFIRSSRERIEELDQRSQKIRRVVMAALSVLTLLALIGMVWAVLNQVELVAQRDEARKNEEIARFHQGKALLQLSEAARDSGDNLQAIMHAATATGYQGRGETTESLSNDGESTSLLLSEPIKSDLALESSRKHLQKRANELIDTLRPTFLPIWSSPPKLHHGGDVVDAAYTPDGKTIASAASDGLVKIWNVTTGDLQYTFRLPTGSAIRVAFDPDGKFLAAGSDENKITIWNIAAEKIVANLESYHDPVLALEFNLDGDHLKTASKSKRFRKWNTETWEEVSTPSKNYEKSDEFVALSPDWRFLVAGPDDNLVNVYDYESGVQVNSFKGHENRVISAAFSPDGKRLASVSNDGDLKLWSLDRGVELSIATAGGGFSLSKEHRKIITAVNFSPDGKWFATGSKDGMISLWDSETRTRLSAFTEHLTYVNRVVFRPDGRQLATVAGDGRVLLWDISTDGKLGLNAAETEFVVSAAVSPEAVVLATGTNTGKIILRDATTGRMLRDALTGAEVEPIKAHDDWVTYLDFTPDGGLLASGSSDSAVKIWDTRTREEIHSLDGHANAVNGVDFSPDGSLLASASDDGTVKVWDVDTGKCLRSLSNGREVANDIEFDPNGSLLAMAWSDGSIELLGLDKSSTPETVLVGHTESVYCIAFSPNGLLLASGSDDNSMRLWNVVTGKEVNYNGVGEALYSLAFSPDGNSVARGLESGVIDVKSLHYDEDGDVTTGSSVFSNSHSLEVTELFFTPDGNRLVSCGSDGTAKIWDMCRTAELSDWSVRSDDVGVECVAFSPDGKLLIAGADEGTLSVVDAQTGAKLGVFQGEKGVSCLAFSFDGLSFAKGSYDASLLLFDAGSGMILKSFYGNTEPVRSLAFSPTGRTLASGGDGGELRLWDIESGAELHSLKADGTVFSIAFSTDGMLLAAGTSVGIQLWDLKSATRLSPIGEGNNAAICVAFSPDGKHLASGGSDRVVSLWNLTDQRFERAFPVERQIDSLAFSPDAKTLSCAAGREVRLWDLATGVQLANFAEHAGVVWSVAFSPDGNRLASASTKGEVKIWDTKRGPIADSWSGPSAGGGNSVGDAETIQGDKLNLQQFSDRRLVTRLDDSVSSRHTTNSLSRDLPLPLIPVRRDTLGRLADPNLTGTERAELRMLYCAETRQPRAARALWKQLVEGSFDTGATSKLRTYYLKALIYGALEQRERDPKFTKVLMHDISTLLGRENLADASLAFTAFNLLERIVVSPETDDSVFSEGGLFRILEESGPPRSHHRLAALLDLCLKGDMLSVGSRDRLRAVLQDFGRRHPDSIEVQFFVRIAEIDALPPRSPDWLREVIELPKYLNGDSSVLIELGELALESSGAPLLALESNGAVELLQIMFSGDEYFETDEDWILACIDWSARIDEFEKAIQFAERLDTADAWRRLAAHQGGEAALASWDRVLKDQGAILEDFVKAGLVATKLEKLGKLREIYNVAQQSFPNKMGELNYLFADALYSLRETEESIQRLERTIEDPGDLVVGDAYVGLSLVLRGAGRESESKGVLSKFSSKADSLQQYLEHLLYRSDENSAFKTAGHFEVLPSLFLEFLKQPRDRESFDVFGLFGYCFLLSQDESIALDAFARARDTSDASHQYESALLLGEAVAHWKLDQAEFAISKFRELITMGEFLGEEFDWSSEEAIAEMGGNPIFISAINEIRAAAVVEDADRHPASGAEQSIDITPKSAMSDAGTFPMSNLYSSSNSLVDQAISQWRSGDNDGAIATFRMLISTGSLTTPPTDWSDPKVVEQLDLGEFDRLTVEAVRAEAVKGFPILTSPRTPSSSFRGPQKTEPQKPPTEIIDFSPIRLSRP